MHHRQSINNTARVLSFREDAPTEVPDTSALCVKTAGGYVELAAGGGRRWGIAPTTRSRCWSIVGEEGAPSSGAPWRWQMPASPLSKVLYTAEAVVEGGRTGHGRST